MMLLKKLKSYIKSNLVINIIPFIILAHFSWLMIQIVWQYIPYNLDVGFLRIKQHFLQIDFWRWAFFIHVYSSFFTLIAGFTQFSGKLIFSAPRVHRLLGYIYVIFVLFLSGPSGLIISFFANGGLVSVVGFLILSILWIYFTAMAIIKVRQGKLSEHRQFMIRSYAMTLSAITLRSWKYLIANIFDLSPMDVYMVISWLGWVLNLILAESWIRLTKADPLT